MARTILFGVDVDVKPKLLILSLLGGAPGAFIVYKILKAIYCGLTSPYRKLPGPRRTSWVLGNITELVKDNNNGLIERWVEQYGTTFKWYGFFGQPVMYTADTKAIHHFLTHTAIYQKSEMLRASLTRVVGPGILVVEGNEHRQQRKIMNPAFGAAHIRELTPIFLEKSAELRDIWASQAARARGVVRVDGLSWLSKATLDIIGLAGFNYEINSLRAADGTPRDELAAAFETIFAAETGFSVFRFVQILIPILRHVRTPTDRRVDAAQATMARIGRRLLAESKREMLDGGGSARARDLLSLLVRANAAKEVPENQGLSDEDVIAQVPTFLVAGHETTSTAVAWALFQLTQNTDVQTRLRAELLEVDTDTPTAEALNALPFLDCVVRETLRLHAPVPSTSRIALQDDVAPLATPFADSASVVHAHLRIPKGQMIGIPILALNRAPAIWGANAMQFVPARWESSNATANEIPGVWGHTLTFLGGPRGCIGFRFALDEMKSLLFTLVRAFEFDLAVPGSDIGKKATAIVERPIVLSEPKAGFQLPLLVKPLSR